MTEQLYVGMNYHRMEPDGGRKLHETQSRENAASNEYQKTITLATLLPDIVLQCSRVQGKERWRFDCILLLGDISGFTALTEKYTLTGKGGTYRMTKTLNAYMGKMVEEIMNHDGDVFKFSGDAFLCGWKVSSGNDMAHTMQKAVKCALIIQHQLGQYETDVKVSLRVKLALSAGSATFAMIGTEETRHYIICGDPINEVRTTEYLCVPGDIILSPSAWKLCNPHDYMYTSRGDLGHIKVIGAINIPRLISPEEIASENNLNHGLGSFRSTLTDAADNQDGPFLRPFIITPVLMQVDHEQPLEYLTEMRQVVSMFVNVLSEEMSEDRYVTMVNEAYCIICKYSQESLGCVNKVSVFDKGLMFLVLFSLRGFCHYMDIKYAIWCANNVQKTVSRIEGVTTVSIGIATGITYCGVVGHPMRREYTVIGSMVNKAARIMVAYPGRITCEKNTFLHSKLPITYFRLQEPKELKGLSSVGPIYEILEEEDKKGNPSDEGIFPILGRGHVIHLFLSKLAAFRDERRRIMKCREEGIPDPERVHHSGILFHGEPRIGKTRILRELCTLTRQRGLPVTIVSLTSSHHQSPFAAVAYIFEILIGINDLIMKSTMKEKENILLTRFGSKLHSSELCYLNDVFQVQFLIADSYINESSHKRMMNRREVLCKLLNLCISGSDIHVIGLDDIHHADPPSAIILSSFLSCEGVMWITTVSGEIPSEPIDQSSLDEGGINFLSISDSQAALNLFYHHPRLHCDHLTGLPLEFMAPLACQILEVRGIPSVLEIVLQKDSQGNPGWVESYLVSLMQTGALLTVKWDEEDPQHENLIIPKENLVMRQEIKKLIDHSHNVEDAKMISDTEVMIQEEHKDSFSYGRHMKRTLDKDDPEMLASLVNQQVCIIAPHYNFEDTSIPKTMYDVVMTSIDSLDPFAQLLVKVASVLGNTCMRMMLVAVMEYPGTKRVAIAVRDVFDARILCCGRPYASKRSKAANLKPTDLKEISTKSPYAPECWCHAGYQLNVGTYLPKYAFCSLLKFQTPLYRDAAYGLLTDDQKKDFHGRAVQFLEGEAHKCRACGGGPFFKVPSLNAPVSEWLAAYEMADMELEDNSSLHESELKGNVESETVERIVSTECKDHEWITSMGYKKLPSFSKANKTEGWADVGASRNPSHEGFNITDTFFECFGLRRGKKEGMVHRCDSDSSLGICLSQVDLFHCECYTILSSVYIHLIEHCKAAGDTNKLIPFLIEFGAAAVPFGISTQAAKLLGEAGILLQNMIIDGRKSDSIQFALGKIRALQGQALFDIGQHQMAHTILLSALETYGNPLPTIGFRARVFLAKEAFNLWLIQHIPFLNSGRFHRPKASYNVMAECLSLIFKINMTENNWRLAKLAAVVELNKAEKAKRNFVTLCRAYCDSMEFYMLNGQLKQCRYLEHLALRLCHQMSEKVANDRAQLQVLSRLYYVSFNVRLLRGELEAAIRVGFRAIRLVKKMQQSTAARLQILPLLVQSLMMRRRLSEAVDMLQELAHLADEDSDSSAMTWYYALCLDFLLNTGFTLEKYATCKAYADQRLDSTNVASIKDPNADRRLLVSLWLWCVRCERWEEAMAWEDQSGFSLGISSVSAVVASLGLDDYMHPKTMLLSCFPNLCTSYKYLEGLQLILVGKVDQRAFSVIPTIHSRIIHVTAILKKVSSFAHVLKPRLTHLRAHFSMIKADAAHAMWLLDEAANLSEKHGNLMEDAWIDHSRKVWLGIIPGSSKDFWRIHCDGEPLDWHEGEHIQWSSIMFSLSIPLNVL